VEKMSNSTYYELTGQSLNLHAILDTENHEAGN